MSMTANLSAFAAPVAGETNKSYKEIEEIEYLRIELSRINCKDIACRKIAVLLRKNKRMR